MSCDGVVDCLPHKTLLARLSNRYQGLVLRAQSPQPKNLESAPHLKNPKGCSITIANHPCGAVPMLTVSHHDDLAVILANPRTNEA
ncbi:hypothetical protein SynPROS91_01541 [Synechococcus sp. PROS-9-1]|nr:hypothetical protein SynPROS91_01541 [Synechococcus sp. PROS-9-1]